MTRTLTAAMKTAAAAVTGEIFHLFDLGFSGGTLYLTDASNDVLWSGNTYTAIGGLGYAAVQENTVLSAQSVRLTLDGVDTSIITRILQQNYIGQTAIIRFAHMATDGTITSNPVIVFQGLMNDAFEVRESFGREGGGATVTTRLVSPFGIAKRTNGIRATVASHSAVFPGDTFWRHTEKVSGRPPLWGNPAPGAVLGGGGSGGGGGGDSPELF